MLLHIVSFLSFVGFGIILLRASQWADQTRMDRQRMRVKPELCYEEPDVDARQTIYMQAPKRHRLG